MTVKTFFPLCLLIASVLALAPNAWAQKPVHAIEPGNTALVAQGKKVYLAHCASCHGKNLEGEKHWRVRKPNGTLPAPPHDKTGYTWQHSDFMLYFIVKMGGHAVAPPTFKTAMPAFKNVLSDREIWAVLSYIKSRWPKKIQNTQDKVNERMREMNR